ncbi:MAG: hypothetical protein ABSA74_03745 [Candidatus Staskawiczbacteria bacterium]|jgi:hypothetical protein
MDLTTIIIIIAVMVVIYLFIRLIVSPLIQIALVIIALLVALYILQRFFNFDLSRVLGPYSGYLDFSKIEPYINWATGPANYYIDQLKTFTNFVWQNFSTATSKH